MGAIVKILLFLLGAAVFILTGLSAAATAGVDTDSLLMSMGEAPGGVATSVQHTFGSGLDKLGGLIAGWTGQADAEGGAVQQWAPIGIAAIVSALIMMISTRR